MAIVEDLLRRLAEAESNFAESESKLNAANKELRQTTIGEYLEGYHRYIFTSLQLGPPDKSVAGKGTKVDGKYVPLWLHPWEAFPGEQARQLARIEAKLGNERLFHNINTIRNNREAACPNPIINENGAKMFIQHAVEAPLRHFILALQKTYPAFCEELGFSGLYLGDQYSETKTTTSTSAQSVAVTPTVSRGRGEAGPANFRQSGSRKKMAVSADAPQQIKSKTYPDGLGYRVDAGDNKTLVFVIEYKAPTKFSLNGLEAALLNSSLFKEVIQRESSTRLVNKTEDEQNRDTADCQVAMALTQTYDYMIDRGVYYGIATAGEALVFLHIEQDDIRTLYYHLCAPSEAADDGSGGVVTSQTAVAQYIAFCLMALGSDTVPEGTAAERAQENDVHIWPNAYHEWEVTSSVSSQSNIDSQVSKTSEYVPPGQSRSGRRPAGQQGSRNDAEPLSRRDGEDDDDERDEGSKGAGGADWFARDGGWPTRTRQASKRTREERSESEDSVDEKNYVAFRASQTKYCTQACLLGLKRGWRLDDKCPNVAMHRAGRAARRSGHESAADVDADRHPIGQDEFVSLVGDRMWRNCYHDCAAVDKNGLMGGVGRTGALFKMRLAPYGYLFVGKGVEDHDRWRLEHEGDVYRQLEALQGDVVPVHLGLVALAGNGYYVPAVQRVMRVVHMMLMSWAGPRASAAAVMKEEYRLLRSLKKAGVDQGDTHGGNLLWSEELGRLMIIDFDRATFLPPPKPMQVLRLMEKGGGQRQKRRRQQTPSEEKPRPRKRLMTSIAADGDGDVAAARGNNE